MFQITGIKMSITYKKLNKLLMNILEHLIYCIYQNPKNMTVCGWIQPVLDGKKKLVRLPCSSHLQ